MNIEQTKTIPLSVILNKMRYVVQRERGRTLWYFSPFRKEKTPSFKVNTKMNKWFDFGLGKGGDAIDLVCGYLKRCKEDGTVADALRWIGRMTNDTPIIPPVCDEECDECETTDKTFVKNDVIPIQSMGLIRYGQARGIPESVLRKHLREIRFSNTRTGKTIYALGLKNESDGYEARNRGFKGCIGKKDVTFFNHEPTPPGIHVFEGMFDYLTAIVLREGKPFTDDVMILNTLSCLNKGAGMIAGFGYTNCYTWMDNDEPGRKATQSWAEFCKNQNLVHVPMNKEYAPYKDANASLIAKLEFKPQ